MLTPPSVVEWSLVLTSYRLISNVTDIQLAFSTESLRHFHLHLFIKIGPRPGWPGANLIS